MFQYLMAIYMYIYDNIIYQWNKSEIVLNQNLVYERIFYDEPATIVYTKIWKNFVMII